MNNLDNLLQLTKAQKDLRWLKKAFWNVRRHLTNNPDDLQNAERQLIEIKTMHDETERKIKELNNAITLNSPIFKPSKPAEHRQRFSGPYVDLCTPLDLSYDCSTGSITINLDGQTVTVVAGNNNV
tara:strand:- start:136 stop:513 length:378 start_codon:yes stop_codon:yes gene_type:complete